MAIGAQKRQAICSMHLKGMSMRAIAEQQNVWVGSVKRCLQQAGFAVLERNIVKCLRTDDDVLIGTYCGLWAGDGTQYYDKGYRIKICLHSANTELIAFTQDLLWRLFGKKTLFVLDHGGYSGFVRFKSKFIYNFVGEYLQYDDYKTKTVALKSEFSAYSEGFLEGFFLGLMLSDGHLGNRFSYQSISTRLAYDFYELVLHFGMNPRCSTADRARMGWNDLHFICLNQKDALRAEAILCAILNKAGYDKTFREIKGVFP